MELVSFLNEQLTIRRNRKTLGKAPRCSNGGNLTMTCGAATGAQHSNGIRHIPSLEDNDKELMGTPDTTRLL